MATNYEIIRDHYVASADGDIDGMFAPFSPDIVWKEMDGFPYAGTYHGMDELMAGVFERIGEDWDGFRVEIDELIDGGDTIVALGHYHATYKATGKPMKARVAHVWRLEGGQVVGFEQFADTHTARLALS
jgi:hypothetical protein